MDINLFIQLLKPDTLTLIVSAVLLVLAVLTPLLSPFFRAAKPLSPLPSAFSSAPSSLPSPLSPIKLSLILTPHDNAEQLTRHLDAYLSQDYPDYEVIVVTWRGDHETDDLLKRYADNPRLYTTYIPDSSRYMPKEKLAVTLGVKAAHHEWVMLADIACKPDTGQWLATMAAQCTDGRNLVLTHTRYDSQTPAFRRYERLYKELYLVRSAMCTQAYRGLGGALLFRKSDFMKGEGYRGNLKYLRGEFDFLVNKYALPHSTALALDPQAWLTEEEPTDKHWRTQQLFYMENRQHLERSHAHRWPYNLHQTALHTNLLLDTAAIILAAVTQRWLLLGVAIVALIAATCVRTLMAARTLRAWHEHLPAMLLPFLEVRLAWHALALFRRYRRANKNDFISHKL